MRGLNPGIDFSGGRTYVIRFDEKVNTADVASRLSDAFGEAPQVVTYGSDEQVRITTKYKINETGVDEEVETLLYEGLKDMVGAGVTRDVFLSKYRQSSETVGPTIAADIKSRAVMAVILATIIMFIYIFIRFKNWQYGMGAVASQSMIPWWFLVSTHCCGVLCPSLWRLTSRS